MARHAQRAQRPNLPAQLPAAIAAARAIPPHLPAFFALPCPAPSSMPLSPGAPSCHLLFLLTSLGPFLRLPHPAPSTSALYNASGCHTCPLYACKRHFTAPAPGAITCLLALRTRQTRCCAFPAPSAIACSSHLPSTPPPAAFAARRLPCRRYLRFTVPAPSSLLPRSPPLPPPPGEQAFVLLPRTAHGLGGFCCAHHSLPAMQQRGPSFSANRHFSVSASPGFICSGG